MSPYNCNLIFATTIARQHPTKSEVKEMIEEVLTVQRDFMPTMHFFLFVLTYKCCI